MGHEPVASADAAGYQLGDLITDLGQHRVSRDGSHILLPHLSYEQRPALTRAAPEVLDFDRLSARVGPGLG